MNEQCPNCRSRKTYITPRVLTCTTCGTSTDIDESQELARLREDKLRHEREVEQFNAGFDAGEAGKPQEEPRYEHNEDIWDSGYRVGAWSGLQAELARLREITRRHKTADGVLVGKGDCVFNTDGRKLYVECAAFEEVCVDAETDQWQLGASWGLCLCYSTREAAEKAKEAKP